MPAGLDVRVALGGIPEVDAPVDAAHDGSGIGDVRQPERVSQLVGEHLIENQLGRRLSTPLRLGDLDTDRQRDHSTGVGPQEGLAHEA
jgi:hypothetical protein